MGFAPLKVILPLFPFFRICHAFTSSAAWLPISSSLPSTTLFDATNNKSTSGSSAICQKKIDDDKTLDDEFTPFLQMVSFYDFSPISDPELVRNSIFEALCDIRGLRGTVYLAEEGINTQLAVPVGEGQEDTLDRVLSIFSDKLPFDPFEINAPNLGDVVDSSIIPTFDRLIVRIRDLILRDGLDERLDWSDAGIELSATEWDEDVRKYGSSSDSDNGLILDCRNMYETERGTFNGAEPLGTNVFSESWAELELKTEGADKNKPVHIFCTGGIRCVKVGAFLKQKMGFNDVRRLEKGIIGYQSWARENFENQSESVWNGENFMFDKRRQVNNESEETKDCSNQ